MPEIIYDNSSGDNPDFYSRTEEYGDEVYLKAEPSGKAWALTDFSVEYFGDFDPQGDETGRIRIYKNDGEGRYPAPGTLLQESEDFPLKKGFQTQTLGGLNITVPNSFTWTIQFKGLRNVKGDSAGLLLRYVPDVGRSFKDFWIKNPAGWRLATIPPANPGFPVDPVTNPDPIENFGCRIYGLPASPQTSPDIRIRPDGKFVNIEWFGGGRLQVADSIAGPFADVPGAATPFAVKIDAGAVKFWREAAGSPAGQLKASPNAGGVDFE